MKNINFGKMRILILLFCVISLVGNAQDLNRGLMAYYDFSKGCNDQSGHGNTGYTEGSARILDGEGAAVFFGPKQPGCIHVSKSSSLRVSSQWSVSVDIFLSSNELMDGYGRVSKEGNGCLFAKSTDRNGVCAFASPPGNKLEVSIGTWGAEGASATLNTSNYLNKYINVVFTYDNGTVRIYINGELKTNKRVTFNFNSTNNNDLYIGKFSNVWYPFAGKIDNFRWYNRVLTASDVSALANSSSSGSMASSNSPTFAQNYKNKTFGWETNLETKMPNGYKGLKKKVRLFLDERFANAKQNDDGRLMVDFLNLEYKDRRKLCNRFDIVTYINEKQEYTTVSLLERKYDMDIHDYKPVLSKPNYAYPKFNDLIQVLFLKKGDYKNYALKHLAECAQSKVVTDGKKAGAYIHFPGKSMPSKLLMYCDVIWNGSVEDGKITGSGQGYYLMGSAITYFTGTFKNGYPSDCRFYRYAPIDEDEIFQGKKVEGNMIKVEDFSDGLAAATTSYNDCYVFIDTNGDVVIGPKYKKVIAPFRNGKAIVLNNSKNEEIVIDKNGNYVDISDNQKRINAEREAARIAAERAERERLEAERRRQAREEAERKKNERIAAIDRELENLFQQGKQMVLNEWKRTSSVGKNVYWKEKIVYDISSGNSGFLGSLLENALGTNKVSYEVMFVAVVESVIGSSACKTVITRAEIQDPSWVSMNYRDYRKYAANDIQKYIGQTRVKQFDEIQLATQISEAELESLFENAIRNTPEGQAIQNKMNELKEEKRRIQDEPIEGY